MEAKIQKINMLETITKQQTKFDEEVYFSWMQPVRG